MKIFTDTKVCGGCGQECTIWTDGQRAYAKCGESFESVEFDRTVAVVSVRCGCVNTVSDEECAGWVDFNLVETVWSEATPEVLILMSHAQEIEVTA
jgi:hypothetical protein